MVLILRRQNTVSKNGELTPAELTYMGNGIYLSNATAIAFNKMSVDIFNALGVHTRITPPDGGYRDLASQQYRYDHPQGPVPIAVPGASSHGMGTAVDISNFYLMYNWLKAHANNYGFDQQFNSEEWHWRYINTTISGNSGYKINGEENMARILNIRTTSDGINSDGKIYFDGPGGIKHIDNPDDLSFLERYIADKVGDIIYPSQLDIVNKYLNNDVSLLLNTIQTTILNAISKISVVGSTVTNMQPILDELQLISNKLDAPVSYPTFNFSGTAVPNLILK